jgi:peptidoglycan/xylan/chitin deacetylase (PgdA/CDA1 family)
MVKIWKDGTNLNIEDETGMLSMPSIRDTVDGVVAVKNGEVAAATVSDLLPPPNTFARKTSAQGKLVISWDDGKLSNWNVLKPIIDDFPEQSHTFFLTTSYLDTPGYMTSAQVLALHAANQELGGHGHMHLNMPTLTAAQRGEDHDIMLAEFAAKGLPRPTSYAYPFGFRTHTTDSECYLRYKCVFDAYGTLMGHKWGVRNLSQLGTSFYAPRHGFAFSNWEDSMELVRLAHRSPVLVHLFSHQPGSDMTALQIRELCTLAHNLGVPIVKASDAIPSVSNVINAGFEDGLTGWKTDVVNGYTMASVVDTPAVGYSGVRSLRLTGTSNTGSIYASQFVPAVAGQNYTLSCRARNETTSGSGSFVLRVQPLNHLFGSLGSAVSSAAITSSTWTQASVAVTPGAGCEMVRIDILLTDRTGEVFADHVHWGLTDYGVLG